MERDIDNQEHNCTPYRCPEK